MTKTYATWYNMRRRCTDPQHLTAARYQQKGVTISDAWRDYRQFLKDMGEQPPNTTLDRIDSSKGYSKENCRWATSFQQSHNKRLYSNSSTKIKGVSWHTQRKQWRAYGKLYPHAPIQQLYYGPDFFEACCKRKSWELKHGVRA